MRINLNSVMVDDQEKALKFYTESLGFVKKADVPVGEYRWITVVSPEEGDDIELVLEPLGFPRRRSIRRPFSTRESRRLRLNPKTSRRSTPG